MDTRTRRDGRPIEELGHYDPMAKNNVNQTVFDVSRIRYWLSVGAQPSPKVAALLRKNGITKPLPGEDWKVAEPAPAEAAATPAPASATATPAPAEAAVS